MREKATGRSEGPGFKDLLDSYLKDVKISRHAADRLRQSKVDLRPRAGQIREAMDRIARKGGRESLLVFDDLALIVNVPNRTVITAVGEDRMKEDIFTNIDSAVILRSRTPEGSSRPVNDGPGPRRQGR